MARHVQFSNGGMSTPCGKGVAAGKVKVASGTSLPWCGTRRTPLDVHGPRNSVARTSATMAPAQSPT
eukprot:9538999-Karenia_brevis.AAC.1